MEIVIGKQELRDQKERMVEEWEISEEEAEEAFKNVKTQVTMAAQDLGKGWSDETLNAVTNLVVAIQQQQYQNSRRSRSNFYTRIFNFITGSLASAFVGVGVYLLASGDYKLAGIFLIAWAIGMIFQHLRQ